MEVSFKLLDNSKDIKDKILAAMLPELDKFLIKGMKKLKSRLPIVVREAITNSPEYESLSNGKLKYEFGIANVDSKLASLIEVWTTNILYEYSAPTLSNGKIKASFSASMIKADFSDVLYADYAAVVDTVRGYTLPWLEWLLLEGNKVIVKKQDVFLGPNKSSRTGFAVMRQSSKSWKVPSEFAGTINNNWITRALDSAESKIQAIIEESFS